MQASKSKHPTYNNKPVPTFQLLSKLAKFQGERKDIVGKTPQEILNSTNAAMSSMNQFAPTSTSQSDDLIMQYQQRSEERNQQKQIEKEYAAYLDPNYKPPDPSAKAENTTHRYKYNAHMNSAVGKILKPEENAGDNPETVSEWASQSKRMGNQKVSNFNNSLIGGQVSDGDPYQTTTQLMNNGEDPLHKKMANRKKLVHKFNPELFTSPITGDPIADYGDWKETIQNEGTFKLQEEKDGDAQALDDPILQKLKTQLSLRGAKGIIGLGRLFRIMDDDGSNTLSFQEFKKAMKEFGMSLSDTETILLFKKFDTQNTGAISYNSFLTTIAGALNKRRAKFVNMAFDIMDKDGNGFIELSDLAGTYNASKHPDVLSGKKTEDQVLIEFLDTFTPSGHDEDHKITREEFKQYYASVSASIDRDDYFELMMRNAWHISGGEGASANSANRRVLVTLSDGSQEVVEIQNDLGLNIKDTKEVLKRLKQQGVDAVKISAFDSNDSTDPASKTKGKPNLARGSNRPSTRGKGGKGFAVPRGDESGNPDQPNPTVAPTAGTKLLIDRVKKALKLRGVNSFFDLQRRFKIMDDDNSGTISYSEFKKAIKEIQSLQDLTDNDLRTLFAYFDTDKSGSIDFNEFVYGIRDPMNEKRLFLVKKAFSRLDSDGNGTIELQDIINVYDTSKHPEVIAKRKTKNQVLTEFLANFEVGGTVDGKVTMDEFINYYQNISASIDNDNYFELMICNAWHITATEDSDGKKTSTYNTANLRVRVTNSQGIDEVVTLENDLGINSSNKDDIKLLYARLRAQGVDDIYAINGKIIKVINVNGVEIITTIGETSLLNKEEKNSNYNPNASAPKVLKAPPIRRPQSASAIPMHGSNRPPIAGMPEVTSSKINLQQKVSSAVNGGGTTSIRNVGGKSNSANLQTNPANLAQNILSNLNKQKAVNQKIQEENIVGNTLLDVLRVQLLSKGMNGIVELQRQFQEFDQNQNGFIELDEFKAVIIQALQLTFSEEQVETIFHYLDKDGSGGIDYYELLEGLRGPINPKLLILIHQIFDRLDSQGQNAITPDVLLRNFRANRHPAVMTGNVSEEQVMQEFLDTFDVGTIQAGIITRDEFVRYYHNLNMVINDDDYMELILRRVWNCNEGDDLADLQQQQQQQQQQQNSRNVVKNRLQNAQTFAHEYWGEPAPTMRNNDMNNNTFGGGNRPMRPSTAGSVGNRYQSSIPRQEMNNAALNVQGSNRFYSEPPVGDQSFAPARPKSASQIRPSNRSYQLMGNNNSRSGSQSSYSNQPVTPQMVEEKASSLRRDAILEFNAGNFKDALEYFKLVLQLLQSLYPPNHPECVKAEKSILLTQRKMQQIR